MAHKVYKGVRELFLVHKSCLAAQPPSRSGKGGKNENKGACGDGGESGGHSMATFPSFSFRSLSLGVHCTAGEVYVMAQKLCGQAKEKIKISSFYSLLNEGNNKVCS